MKFLVTGHVIIGKNCTIGPAVRLGPYVSIGSNTTLKKCDVENSIVMEGAKIDAKIHLVDNIIAHKSEIEDHTHQKEAPVPARWEISDKAVILPPSKSPELLGTHFTFRISFDFARKSAASTMV